MNTWYHDLNRGVEIILFYWILHFSDQKLVESLSDEQILSMPIFSLFCDFDSESDFYSKLSNGSRRRRQRI